MTQGIVRKLQNNASPQITKSLKKESYLAERNRLFADKNQLTLTQVVENILNPANDDTSATYFSSSRFFGPAIPRSAQKMLAAAYIKEFGQNETFDNAGVFLFDKFKAFFKNHENKNYHSIASHLKESYFKNMIVAEVGTSNPHSKNDSLYFIPASTAKAKVISSVDTLSSILSFLPAGEQALATRANSQLRSVVEKRPAPQLNAHKELAKNLMSNFKSYPALNTQNWRELILNSHITLEEAVKLAAQSPKMVKAVSKGDIAGACKLMSTQALALLEKIGIRPQETQEYNCGTNEIYKGQWKAGEFHGQGTYKWASGDSYTGEWVNDQKHGQGTFKWASGHTYTGEWVNNQRHGQGTYKWAIGNSYVGEWVSNQQDGQGAYKCVNNDFFSGFYQNDLPVGAVIFTFMNGAVYKGEIEAGPIRFTGPATVQFVKGKKFEGNFIYNAQLKVSVAQGILKDIEKNTQENFELTIKFDGVNATEITGKPIVQTIRF